MAEKVGVGCVTFRYICPYKGFISFTYRRYSTANHKSLRLSAVLLFIGIVVSDILQYLHPGGGPTYEDAFANYAASGQWAAIHLSQFVGEAILLAGLIVLFFALNLSEGIPHWLGLFGAISAGDCWFVEMGQQSSSICLFDKLSSKW